MSSSLPPVGLGGTTFTVEADGAAEAFAVGRVEGVIAATMGAAEREGALATTVGPVVAEGGGTGARFSAELALEEAWAFRSRAMSPAP